MAQRPWVTPQELKDFSEHESVQNRNEERLKVDIFRAENYVINFTRNRFDDDEKFPTIPDAVRIAVLMIAEQYAIRAADSSGSASGRFKSERFDDYSYTLADNDELFDNLDLGPLLNDYVVSENAGADVVMRMRRL